jgi:hypothetical protein
MFIQVIQGNVKDADALRASMDQWISDLAPGAAGWVGSTAGVTEDGRFIATARFESEAAARTNSDRPEQGEWWSRTEGALSDVTFHDCTDVTLINGGGSDRAGFVQVMQTAGGSPEGQARLREIGEQLTPHLAEMRPDLMGLTVAVHDDGGTTQLAYFTSEAAAREGEQKPPPPELMDQMQEMAELMGEVDYYDLRDPWLYSA